uniref:Uncharacterized protein n=1 Tax=Trichogramma kaykai TaxID=54128 RepID=A0ABD2VWA1_9HYME
MTTSIFQIFSTARSSSTSPMYKITTLGYQSPRAHLSAGHAVQCDLLLTPKLGKTRRKSCARRSHPRPRVSLPGSFLAGRDRSRKLYIAWQRRFARPRRWPHYDDRRDDPDERIFSANKRSYYDEIQAHTYNDGQR